MLALEALTSVATLNNLASSTRAAGLPKFRRLAYREYKVFRKRVSRVSYLRLAGGSRMGSMLDSGTECRTF